jgi:hypothetical protein
MPCYNAGRFLEAAIRSIAGQTFRNWELLVVDDASTDTSLEIATGWARRDPRIHVLANQRNKGQTACLNQGLREATGTWIARQDADDLSHPLRLTRQFELVTVHPELVLVGTAARIIDAADRLCGLLDVPLGVESIRVACTFLNPFVHTAAFFHREKVLGGFGGYDEAFRIAQDYDLWERIVEKHPSANLAARLVCYRHLSSSLSKTGSACAFAEATRVADRAWARRSPPAAGPDHAALMALREGQGEPERVAKALHRIEAALPRSERKGWRAYSALLTLKAAGASRSWSVRLGGIARAVATSPASSLRWLLERTLAS